MLSGRIGKTLLAALIGTISLGAQAKTLVYCSEGSPEGFDPARYTSGTTFDATAEPVFNRLVEFESGTTKVLPALAEKFEISPDGKTYTFKLRRNVKFHTTDYFKPTRDFNADDVIFTFDRLRNAEHPFNKAYGTPVYPYAKNIGLDNVEAIEKVADDQVRFKLKNVEAPFLTNLAMQVSVIQSAEYADQLVKANKAADLNNKPIGTGPYAFRRYDQDEQIRYDAHPQYWRGKAKNEALVFAITKDSAVRMQKLKAGECQLSSYPKPQEVEAMKSDKNIKIQQLNGLNIGYVAFNTQKKPFDNRDVRIALAMAINKKAIVDAVYSGAATPATNPIPPTLWGYNKSVKDYPNDLVAAKKLLAKAGYPNGFETDLWAMPVQRPYNPDAKKMAELIQADWAKLGVKATIVQYEWGEYLKRGRAGEPQVFMLGWTGDNGDPDNFLNTLLSCASIDSNNYARWCNKEFDELVIKAKQTTDVAQRTKLYEQAQVIFKRESPWVTIAHSIVSQPMRKELEGFKMSPFGRVITYGSELK